MSDSDEDDDDDDDFMIGGQEETQEIPVSGEKHFKYVFVLNTIFHFNSYNPFCRTQYAWHTKITLMV